MSDAIDHKERVREQFGASADAYVASAGHASGNDLAQLIAWARQSAAPARLALDIATGGGHTALALAPHVERVIASDLTPAMLRSAARFIRGQEAHNVSFAAADAERLPFADRAFDLVTCRIAPHHFSDVAAFLREVARVLRPGGSFLLEDSIVPDNPAVAAYLNEIEITRDPTHVRTLSVAEWRAALERIGVQVVAEAIFPKTHPFSDWIARSRLSAEGRVTLERLFREAPPAARDALQITIGPDGEILSHTDEKIVLRAVRQP